MNILYAIQGTGNGHLSRARDVIPALQKHGNVDLLVSGIQADVEIPYNVKYRMKGMSFIFGKKGGVDILKTYKKCDTKQLWKDIKKLEVERYDLVVNDFEPVSAWACYLKKKPCVGLSHQYAVSAQAAPKPKGRDYSGELILRYYAPVSTGYGFHFRSYNERIFTPVIRREVRELEVTNQGHYTVYLPAYDDKKILRVLSRLDNVQWQVFSKHNGQRIEEKNVTISSIDNQEFLRSMASSEGVLCGAGFETPAEALFLGKKLLAVPMKTQFEQQCNAAALRELGVPTIKRFKLKNVDKLEAWVENASTISVDYPDVTQQVVDRLIENHKFEEVTKPDYLLEGALQLG